MIFFDIALVSGIITMCVSYHYHQFHTEGSEIYKLLQSVWNVGFWITFMGLLKYII